MSRRDTIRMTDAEVDEFLAGRRTMNVATIGPDGRPHLVAMWYGFLDGAPAFETYAKSQKVVNLRRDPRVTALVEDGDQYDNLRGVELIGTARVIEEREPLVQVAHSVVERYHADLAADPEAVEQFVQVLVNKRVAVVIDVERVVSWDHAKLAGGY